MNLERAVERSVIGGLLLEPHRVDLVSPWLQLEDFEGTAERQAFAAVLALRQQQTGVTAQAVEARVRETVTPGTQMADAAFLVSVMQETPTASHATVYGRMVLELSIRRRVVEGAIRLRQRAEDATTADEINIVFADVDGIRRAVEALHLRESRAGELHSVAPAIDNGLQRLVRFPRSEELAAEQATVLALVSKPSAIPRVARWLKPGDFGDQEAGMLFKEVVALHEAMNPIDRLTVAWRAAKVGIDGPLTQALASGRSTDSTTAVDPVAYGRQVLTQSVRAAIIATSEELQTAAIDARANPTTVAYTRLNALWPQTRRLTRARMATAYGADGAPG